MMLSVFCIICNLISILEQTKNQTSMLSPVVVYLCDQFIIVISSSLTTFVTAFVTLLFESYKYLKL